MTKYRDFWYRTKHTLSGWTAQVHYDDNPASLSIPTSGTFKSESDAVRAAKQQIDSYYVYRSNETPSEMTW